MRKEAEFLRYNARNILTNAIQAEDHARYMRRGMRPEHYACILKHLAMIRGEVQEAISHSAVVDPSKTAKLRDLLQKVEKVMDDFERGVGPDEAILKLRDIRKTFENIFPTYGTESCVVCAPVEVATKVADSLRRAEAEGLNFSRGHRHQITMKEEVKRILKEWAPLHAGYFAKKVAPKIHPKVAEVIDPLATIIGAVGSIYVKNPEYADALLLWGGYHSTFLWDRALPKISGAIARVTGKKVKGRVEEYSAVEVAPTAGASTFVETW